MGQQAVVFVPVGYALTLTAVSAGSYFVVGNPGDQPSGYATLNAAATIDLGPFNAPRSYSLQSGNNDMAYSLAYSGVATAADDAATALLAPKASPTFTGTVVLPSTTSIGTVSATELAYVDGVTSAIQTQLNGKAAKGATVITPLANDADGTAIATAVNGIITALIAAGVLAVA